MNERVARLKQKIHPNGYAICVEKGKLVTESFRQTEGQPQVLRNARAIERVLDNIPIFVQGDELIVGNAASKPMGVELTCLSGIWVDEEVTALEKDGFTLSTEVKREIKLQNDYWKGKSLEARRAQRLNDRLWSFMETGVVLPRLTSREEGQGGGLGLAGSGLGVRPELGAILVDVDMSQVLTGGLNKIISDAEAELESIRFTSADAMRKSDFLNAVIISHKAIIRFAGRFAALCKDLAAQESDVARKKELKNIAEMCLWVPANPARSFREAMQSFWFLFLVLNPSNVISLGRLDQTLYPFYRKDIDAGAITDSDVLELLECLRIKDMELNITAGRVHREKYTGMAKWHNCVIGGQTPEGKDATNEVSYLILEAAKDCPTPHHTITVRVHEGTPEALMQKAIEVIKTGIGMPAFIGDRSCIEYLLAQGVPLRTARGYTLAGCLDVNIPAQSRTGLPMFVVPMVLEYTLNNGRDPKSGKQIGLKTGEFEDFTSFEDLVSAFRKQINYFLGFAAEFKNIMTMVYAELYPQPIESSLMIDALKEGKDIMARTLPFENGGSISAVGVINAADSLAAIKKLVFDEKKVTKKELLKALAADWEGDRYGEIRKMCLSAPKYGNDDDYVDTIASELYKIFADELIGYDTILGGKYKPSAISISAQWPGGALTGATPDGRHSGDCLADGSLSAMRGMDTKGPAALMKSAMKVDQAAYQSTLFNVKFHPSAIATPSDMIKLSTLIRTYLTCGGKHVQFNVVSRDTLEQAKKKPKEHRDLMVRVAGYSAYFVELGAVIQDEIISRTMHEKTT